jgi:hypothetical protein
MTIVPKIDQYIDFEVWTNSLVLGAAAPALPQPDHSKPESVMMYIWGLELVGYLVQPLFDFGIAMNYSMNSMSIDTTNEKIRTVLMADVGLMLPICNIRMPTEVVIPLKLCFHEPGKLEIRV